MIIAKGSYLSQSSQLTPKLHGSAKRWWEAQEILGLLPCIYIYFYIYYTIYVETHLLKQQRVHTHKQKIIIKFPTFFHFFKERNFWYKPIQLIPILTNPTWDTSWYFHLSRVSRCPNHSGSPELWLRPAHREYLWLPSVPDGFAKRYEKSSLLPCMEPDERVSYPHQAGTNPYHLKSIFLGGDGCDRSNEENLTEKKQAYEKVWVVPKIGVGPQIIHFNRGFPWKKHPFWEFSPIFGNITFLDINDLRVRVSLLNDVDQLYQIFFLTLFEGGKRAPCFIEFTH